LTGLSHLSYLYFYEHQLKSKSPKGPCPEPVEGHSAQLSGALGANIFHLTLLEELEDKRIDLLRLFRTDQMPGVQHLDFALPGSSDPEVGRRIWQSRRSRTGQQHPKRRLPRF
jgi:hypothetical protein